MEKNGMNKEVMILIELQAFPLKLEFKLYFYFAQTFIQEVAKKKKKGGKKWKLWIYQLHTIDNKTGIF